MVAVILIVQLMTYRPWDRLSLSFEFWYVNVKPAVPREYVHVTDRVLFYFIHLR